MEPRQRRDAAGGRLRDFPGVVSADGTLSRRALRGFRRVRREAGGIVGGRTAREQIDDQGKVSQPQQDDMRWRPSSGIEDVR